MSDYVDYVGVFSISILAASSSYFLDFSNPVSLAFLSLIPASMGVTAYISRDGFNPASLSSLISLFLVGFNPLVSFVAAVVAVSNPLVSLFAGGESFKDFFNSVTLPMLLTGLIVGGGIYGAAQIDPSTQKTVEDTTVTVVAGQTEVMLDQTALISNTRDQQVNAMKNVSEASVLLTEKIVVENMSSNLTRGELKQLRSSFDYAEQTIPARFNSGTENSTSGKEMVSNRIESSLRNLIDGKTMVAIIPILGLAFYSLSPFVGLLAAVFGVLARTTLEFLES